MAAVAHPARNVDPHEILPRHPLDRSAVCSLLSPSRPPAHLSNNSRACIRGPINRAQQFMRAICNVRAPAGMRDCEWNVKCGDFAMFTIGPRQGESALHGDFGKRLGNARHTRR